MDEKVIAESLAAGMVKSPFGTACKTRNVDMPQNWDGPAVVYTMDSEWPEARRTAGKVMERMERELGRKPVFMPQGKAIAQEMEHGEYLVMFPDGKVEHATDKAHANVKARAWFKKALRGRGDMGAGIIEFRPREMTAERFGVIANRVAAVSDFVLELKTMGFRGSGDEYVVSNRDVAYGEDGGDDERNDSFYERYSDMYREWAGPKEKRVRELASRHGVEVEITKAAQYGMLQVRLLDSKELEKRDLVEDLKKWQDVFYGRYADLEDMVEVMRAIGSPRMNKSVLKVVLPGIKASGLMATKLGRRMSGGMYFDFLGQQEVRVSTGGKVEWVVFGMASTGVRTESASGVTSASQLAGFLKEQYQRM